MHVATNGKSQKGLREKLGSHANRIETLRGEGYRFATRNAADAT